MSLIGRLQDNLWTWREVRQRLLNILVAGDVFLYTLATLGHAKRNQTFSGAAWDLELRGKWQGKTFRPVIDWLFQKVEPAHCHTSWRIENPVHVCQEPLRTHP